MNSRKIILLLTDWYEPGFKAGGPIRSCVNFAAHMKEDYDLHVFTGDRDLGNLTPYNEIETDCWLDKEGLKIYYASPAALNWESILVQINQIKPDYLYLNSMYSRYFTIYPLLMKRLGLIKSKIVLAPRGMLQGGAIQFKSGKKKLFLSVLNGLGIPRHIRAHATDEQEKQDILQFLPQIQSVSVIPNFSSLTRISSVYIEKEKEKLSLIFISRIAPKKNIFYLLSQLSSLPASVQILLTIRGGVEDETYWAKCLSTIDGLPPHITVQYEGPIDHKDVTASIQQHHLFVLPTLGENFGHAIFEALSAGRPVLISDQTPWRNLAEQHAGWDLPLSETNAFIQVLQQVADMDDEIYQQWSFGAWQYAKKFTENSNLKEKYKALFS